MAIYATQQHVLQGELVLLNVSCCLLTEAEPLRRQRLKRNSMEGSIPPKSVVPQQQPKQDRAVSGNFVGDCINLVSPNTFPATTSSLERV